MKSVPVEKCCEKCVCWVTVPERTHQCPCHLKKLIYEALDELQISDVGNEAGIYTIISGKPIAVGKLLDLFSQALQAAKEERDDSWRAFLQKLAWKKEEIDDATEWVDRTPLRLRSNHSLESIINKHQ